MTLEDVNDVLPPPIVVSPQREDLDSLLTKEWLIGNRIGAYASSTVVGCNVRRYHGLLVAASLPPTGRILALSTVMEQLVVGETPYELGTQEFADTFSPRGVVHLAEFRNDVCPTFVFQAGRRELLKQVLLSDSANAAIIRYTLRGGPAALKLWPFTPLRGFHHLRKVHEPNAMGFESADGGVIVQDRMHPEHAVHLLARPGAFQAKPQWWYRFHYRVDISRGQEGFEDLYTPGWFECDLGDGESCELLASLDAGAAVDFDACAAGRRARLSRLAAAMPDAADETTRRLAAATDVFVVQRSFPGAPASATILAGYPWFTDWGRDAFIALPGLLLATGQADQARQVFRTFADHLCDGLVPNRFDDYSASAHYNSIDASLWFIIAAERYLGATGDWDFWSETLQPTSHAILSAYQAGTQFDIRADGDGLLSGGSHRTQLTWMDVALGAEVVTPRHGKAVEVNALWHSAHRILADRCARADEPLGRHYAAQADVIAEAFARTFWNAELGCLYDCITEDGPDASLRPNQILAVSLPYSPLSHEQQAGIVRVVAENLLTPFGLRTLSRGDGHYRRRYGGSWESRDRAYHQGTTWAWLIGAFIEAHLKVNASRPLAAAQAEQMLSAFDEHLSQAGLGYVSEIFDAEAPHTPRGCVAQAWSVAEVLRAKLLVLEHLHPSGAVGTPGLPAKRG